MSQYNFDKVKNDSVGPEPIISVVIPCYRETEYVLDVLADIPPEVSRIYCVDDGCPDGTGDLIRAQCNDPRVYVVENERNLGVGGAVKAGYREALRHGGDIVVKIDADGQMDPAHIMRMVKPILQGRADYTKGNRFYNPEGVRTMPRVRLFGNALLSFLNKFSSGYWRIFDPTNGYTAIHSKVLALLPLDKISNSYLFETDMLYRLSIVRACVHDVPLDARYADEKSHLNPFRWVFPLLSRHCSNFFRRMFYNYFLRDFSVASIEWVLAPVLLVFGVVFGAISWRDALMAGHAATPGTVMLSALPIIIGMQMLLSALNFDVANQPQTALHPMLE